MKKFSEIKKELKEKGVEIRPQKATLGGARAYKVIGSEHNHHALWTADEIKVAYYNGEF